MNLLITGAYQYSDAQLNQLAALNYDITYVQDERVTLTIDVSKFDVVVCNSLFLYNDIKEFTNLRFIQLTSTGLDRAPLENIKENKIQLANARGVYSIPIAEWVILKILELYKNTRFFEINQRNSVWKKSRELLELYGKTIGIIGTGSIGVEIAKRVKAFGCNVLGLNTSGTKKEFFDKCMQSSSLYEFVKQCDIIVLTLPLTDKTQNLINSEVLRSMKDGAILINVSRGEIVNEEDLIKYIETGKLRGVALDVFSEEPLPNKSPLWECPNVILTPHNSFISDNVSSRMFNLIYDNLSRFRENKPLNNYVNI
ncbi:NAD(P)-dependent oxidoreductase [Neobacillus niacini]|uniref:NAD(P)-dependent oxidoreductase n=1 Tax=Neobacillus niacini TaxID=86668 RepID=UPI0005EF5293|nr:NAD(P)-dependent oxidoreductase [Neobacillus niacini]